MKPRTKRQKLVFSLHEQLPKLTEKEYKWIYDKMPKWVYTTKYKQRCFECYHDFESVKGTVICPNCHQTLERLRGKTRTAGESRLFKFVKTFKDFQIVRHFYAHKSVIRNKTDFYIEEVTQQWISEAGNEIISKNLWYYNDTYFGKMEIKHKKNYYKQANLKVFIYPKPKLLPILKRNGLKYGFNGFNPAYLIDLLLKENRAETLFKVKQLDILEHYHSWKSDIDKYWPQIKIAIRNDYKIHNFRNWVDHLGLLVYFNKDIFNPKFICPENFTLEHQKLIEKKKYIIDAKELKKAEKLYYKKKNKFFDLLFKKEEIVIRPLTSVQQFIEESKVGHHCLFNNCYYLKDNSLIFTARKEKTNEYLETIQYDLVSHEVVQVLGKFNNITPYHQTILDIINRRKNKIKQLTT